MHLPLDQIEPYLNLEATFKDWFHRACGFHWKEYLVGTQEQIDMEATWARCRPSVKQRFSDNYNNTRDIFADPPDSLRRCLGTAERVALAKAENQVPGEAVDINQNVDHRLIRTRGGCLQTLIANIGFQYMTRASYETDEEYKNRDRWLLYVEFLTSMGFPITAECQEATGGARCQFSNGVEGPKFRTVKSARKQSGNTIHLNHIGGWTLLTIFKFPHLDEAVEMPGRVVNGGFVSHGSLLPMLKRPAVAMSANSSSSDSSSGSTTSISSFEAAFARTRQHRGERSK